MEKLKIKCRECEGNGGVEVFKDCYRPAGYCCGGCTETVRCDMCDGEGTQEIDFFDEVESIVHNDELTPEEVVRQIKYLLEEIM